MNAYFNCKFRGINIHVRLLNHTIIFVKQFRYAINDFLIELPAGLIEENEKGEMIP